MKIEKMNIADLSQVETLYQAANLFAKKNDILNWTRDGLKKFPNLNLVYKKNKKIIGAISTILKTKNHAEINDIAVDKNNRGQGIGQKLIKKIIDDLKQIGVKKIKRESDDLYFLENQEIEFNATNSVDYDGNKLNYVWEFSDGLYKSEKEIVKRRLLNGSAFM